MDVSKLEIPLWCDSRTLPRNKLPIWLLLHNIQDPMNFGAILRSAYYLGCDSVVVPGSDSCKLSPVVSKASAGAMEVVDLMRLSKNSTETDLCQWWKQQGGEVVGTGRGGNKTCTLETFKMRRPTLLVLGNEGTGIGRELEDCCDTCLFIPQSGESIDSLNVSVATGIILHWIKTSRTSDVLQT
ncbi:rRNA methyltransferase 1, mitochondrial-like [Physella acuta]|uniref:rRNA methyltransferase 1, mitochondrial-like n=1 Tax=Physella acuta TaxID=109671 RepID=UPI0027DC9C64|nr:rRNA methyltransferase 1, mitochondrial-like [Physella acuta]